MEELDNDKKLNQHTVDAAQEILDKMQVSLQKKDYEKLKEFLLKLKATKGLLLTDHYYNDVLDISDKALLLKEGLSHPITTEQDLQQLDYVNHLSP